MFYELQYEFVISSKKLTNHGNFQIA